MKGRELKRISKIKNIDTKLLSRDLDLFIYIGESTSVMNMGVYDYFRNTTPFLSKEKMIIKQFFLKIFFFQIILIPLHP